MQRVTLYILLALLLGGAALWWLLAPEPQPEPTLPPVVAVEELPREVILYFADPAGRYLVSESQEIDGCEDDRDCVRNLFSALVKGPQGELLPVLPTGTEVLGVELKEDLAVVDFSSAFVHSHPGGSLSELLTVYALANSLTVNFPYLKQLQIMVEGQPVTTLKGHVGLTRPVKADFSYSRSPQEAEGETADNE